MNNTDQLGKLTNTGTDPNGCDQVRRDTANDIDEFDKQDLDRTRSILRQPSGKTRSSTSGKSGERNSSSKRTSLIKQSVVTWANNVMSKRRSSVLSNTDDSERKSRRDSFWTR
jgi:hypothetical protein